MSNQASVLPAQSYTTVPKVRDATIGSLSTMASVAHPLSGKPSVNIIMEPVVHPARVNNNSMAVHPPTRKQSISNIWGVNSAAVDVISEKDCPQTALRENLQLAKCPPVQQKHLKVTTKPPNPQVIVTSTSSILHTGNGDIEDGDEIPDPPTKSNIRAGPRKFLVNKSHQDRPEKHGLEYIEKTYVPYVHSVSKPSIVSMNCLSRQHIPGSSSRDSPAQVTAANLTDTIFARRYSSRSNTNPTTIYC